MIQRITDLTPCGAFIRELNRDPEFSDPHLVTREQVEVDLLEAPKNPNKELLGVFRDGEMTGLFVFLKAEEDRNIEMLVGLSRDGDAYEEIADDLQARFPGWQADFVFNPANPLLKALLKRKNACFYQEQHKMVLKNPPERMDTAGVELLTEPFRPQYFAMHSTDLFWTGEKVAAAPDCFHVLLAREGETVVGYLDLRYGFEENEPNDLRVLEAYRRRGWGRKLLAKAIELNRPHGMMLLVDTDNIPALRLYESMGFEKAEGENFLTVSWQIPGPENSCNAGKTVP